MLRKERKYVSRMFEGESIVINDNSVAVYNTRIKVSVQKAYESLGEPEKICLLSRDEMREFCRQHTNKLEQKNQTFILFQEEGDLLVAKIEKNKDLGIFDLVEERFFEYSTERLDAGNHIVARIQ